MKIIFSPSKSQNSNKSLVKSQKPLLFPLQAEILCTKLQALSVNETQELFKISLKKSEELVDMYHQEKIGSVPAIELFSGTSFKELQLLNYSDKQRSYCNNHVCILSALYGILLPDNVISLYRFDVNNNILKDTDYKNVYHFWQPHVTRYFEKEDVIINLASVEYSKMLKDVNQKNIINIHFLIYKNSTIKSISVYAKQQRGKMLNYLIKHEIQNPKKLHQYSSDGFLFNAQKSNSHNYYFIKNLD